MGTESRKGAVTQQQLQSLLEASRLINSTLDHTVIRKALVNAATGLLRAQFGTSGMVEDGRMVFREYRRGDQWSSIDYTFEPGDGVPGHVMQTGKPYMTNDAEHDPHVIPEIRQALDFHQLIDVPIFSRSGELLGCFEIHDPVDGDPFDDTDVKLLEGLAASAAVALENAYLLEEREHQTRLLQQNKERLRLLIEAGIGSTGIDYFRALVRAASNALQVKCAFIAEIKEDGMEEAHALALWIGDDFAENISWKLAGTPCEHIPEGKQTYFTEHVQKEYPDDAWLREIGAESYFGIPFKGADGRVAGYMGILDDKPLPDHEGVAAIFAVFTERAGMEMERMRVEKALQQRMFDVESSRQSMLYMLEDLNESTGKIEQAKEEWEKTFDAVTQPVFLHDADGNIIRANLAYAKQAGVPIGKVIGQPYWQVFPVLDAPMQSCLHARKNKKSEAKEEVSLPDGRLFVSHSYAVRDEHDEYAYSIHFMEDITDRKQHERILKRSLEGTISAVSRSVEARDPYTAGHQQRVATLACAIAGGMGLDAGCIEGIRLGAEIHDIGKIHLPAEILAKPSKLTDIEYEMIKAHPQVGYDILKDIEFPWPVADIAHQHHERLDGSGYPQGLKNGHICMEARIVAVADVVEAISSHRPYRPGLGIDKAVAEIKRGRGKQYDADAVDICIDLVSDNNFKFNG